MKNTLLIHFVCVIFAASFTTINAQSMSHTLSAPVAKKLPKQLKKHNEIRIDDYYWLNDRENPEVIDYLNQENSYYDAMTAHTKDFQKQLFEEMKGRIKEDDQSVPYLYNGYYYITRYEKGQDYPIYSRKKGSLDAPEEILFNCNELAKGHTFFQLGGLSVSPDNRFASFGVDTVGRRIYTIKIKNLETNEILPDVIENATGGSVWANDNHTLFYTRQDKVTLRANQIFKHKLQTSADQDILVFEEKDETFNCFVYKTKSSAFIMIGSGQTLSTEYQFLDANNPSGEFKILQARERNHEYSIDHFEGSFYIVTNWEAKNFRLMKTSVENTQKENWEEVIPHREDVLLEGIDIFSNYYVVSERKAGLNELRIINWKDNSEHYIEFNDPTYTAGSHANPEFNTELFRYSYSSLTTPYSVYDFNMNNHSQKLLKQQEVLDENFKTFERLLGGL